MIRWILRRAIDKFERQWQYDASYMRDLIDAESAGRVAVFPRCRLRTVSA
jgi:hypothetical protein